MRPRIARSVTPVPPRPREGMSRKHLDAVKVLPCIACGRIGAIDPHHLLRGLPEGERGMGRKAADRYSIPACRKCHDAMHQAGDDEAWLTARNIDGRSAAEALWREREDPKRMLRVVVRSLNARGIFVS